MTKIKRLFVIGLMSMSSSALAATTVAFTFATAESDWVQPKAPGVVSRQYKGAGTILFKSTLTDGVYGLADIASAAIDLGIIARVITRPATDITADFRFGLTDLSSFSITYAGGKAIAASFGTSPTKYYQSTAPFNPAPASLDFDSRDARPLAINAFLTPGVKTMFARTTITARVFETAVPEPETWIMMIGGLGLAGIGLRQRRGSMQAA